LAAPRGIRYNSFMDPMTLRTLILIPFVLGMGVIIVERFRQQTSWIKQRDPFAVPPPPRRFAVFSVIAMGVWALVVWLSGLGHAAGIYLG
jgi:hypothetical protein